MIPGFRPVWSWSCQTGAETMATGLEPRTSESEESQDYTQPQPPKSDKRRNVKMSLIRSINLTHQVIMARSSALRLMLT